MNALIDSLYSLLSFIGEEGPLVLNQPLSGDVKEAIANLMTALENDKERI
jgi:hypothetical protein